MIRAWLACLVASTLPAAPDPPLALPAAEAEQVRQALRATAQEEAAEIASDMDLWLMYGPG